MITPTVLSDVLNGLTAKISRCNELVADDLCGWDCCHFADNYILFLPGEWESALELGYTLDQYEVLDPDFLGGTKVVPRDRRCCSKPSNGPLAYKSIDCRVYPFWMQIEDGDLVLIQGRKCPLISRGERVDQHRADVVRTAELLAADPDLAQFFERARMVGYDRVPGAPLRLAGGTAEQRIG